MSEAKSRLQALRGWNHGSSEWASAADGALRYLLACAAEQDTEATPTVRQSSRLCHDSQPADATVDPDLHVGLRECSLRFGHDGDHRDGSQRWTNEREATPPSGGEGDEAAPLYIEGNLTSGPGISLTTTDPKATGRAALHYFSEHGQEPERDTSPPAPAQGEAAVEALARVLYESVRDVDRMPLQGVGWPWESEHLNRDYWRDVARLVLDRGAVPGYGPTPGEQAPGVGAGEVVVSKDDLARVLARANGPTGPESRLRDRLNGSAS